MKESKLLLWKWHVRLNHLPFKKIKILSEQGRIPRKLVKTEILFSHHAYTALQEDASSKETIKVKLAFEQCTRKVGVEIEHYHVDNGRFADNTFINHVKEQGQTITYFELMHIIKMAKRKNLFKIYKKGPES